MRHQPHLYLPGEWGAPQLSVPKGTAQHLTKALRYPDGASVSYTDGRGSIGTGVWAEGAVDRGAEETIPASVPAVTIAVAPPHSKERQRFIVEKSQELGVATLRWIRSDHAQTKAPKSERSHGWAASALEQSRGAWLMSIDEAELLSLTDGVLADASANVDIGDIEVDSCVTVVVGPEGGWSDRERAMFARHVRLPGNVLRTETAAIVAAAYFSN
ncbi:MAG: RsmE family RNA methyltransferase [Acidimicrobiia bacterium]